MNEPNDYVTIRVLFFARAREFTGEKEVCLKVPSSINGNDLLHLITEKFKLEQLDCSVILALNENWIDPKATISLKDADEVAVIPPLSGGTTRDNFQGKTVSKLEYEAYEGMAIKSLETICNNIRQKFDVGNIAIFHRLGDVPIQEASVVIAVSSTHRNSALGAVPYAIDALKADVPIWKKEVYEDGKSSEWKENSESEDITSSVNAEFLQLYEEVVEADTGNEVPTHLIQINASLQEIDRRINSFINRKREQINMSNIQDFCLDSCGNTDDSTCARVSAVLVRRKDSKSHLKVHRVENCVGPQTHDFEPSPYSSSRECFTNSPNCPPGAEERLTNAEIYLNVNPNSRDVYSRLKAIEDKILYLESISPEYFDFDREEKSRRKPLSVHCKKTYTSTELDLKMQRLEAKLQEKSKIK